MTLRVAFRPEAENEIERAHRWYEDQEAGLGAQFLLALEAVLSKASDNPNSFACVARRTHRAVLQRFPYIIFYVAECDHLVITGVFHGHRGPERWAGRIQERAARYGPATPIALAI